LSQSYIYRGISHNAEARLSRLLYRNSHHKFSAYAGGWRRRSSNFIDDTEIAVQRRRTAGWEAGFTHRAYLEQATLDARLALRRGTGAFKSQPAPEEAFGEGTSRMRLTSAEMQLTLPFALRSGADVGRVGGASTRMLAGRTLAGAVLGLRGGAKGAWWDVCIRRHTTTQAQRLPNRIPRHRV